MKRTLYLLTVLSLFFHCFELLAQNIDDTYSERLQEIENIIYSDTLTRNEARKIFREMRIKETYGDAEASCMLGVLFKDGIGTRLNFNKARKLFIRAYNLGSHKAAYSLGYLYLKGLGNIPQDYVKAIQWFEKSEYPMARHWLAKCHYYGYGVSIDKAVGIQILRENPISNSRKLLAQWESQKPRDSISPTKNIAQSSAVDAVIKGPSSTGIKGLVVVGSWEGEWHVMDWSSTKIMRSIPIAIEVSEEGYDMYSYNISVDAEEYTGSMLLDGNEFIFPNLVVTVEEPHVDHVSDKLLQHQITSLVFGLEQAQGGQYLKGELEASILNWKEPAPPGQWVLRRKGTPLDKKVIDAFSAQKDHFIKVYPNPFEQDLLLHYTLDTDAEVLIRIYDYHQPSKVLRTIRKKQKNGERMVTFNNLNSFKKGLYIIDMQVGPKRYSRIIIKK